MASLDGSVRRRSQECQITAAETERVASYRTCTGFRADPLTEVLRNGARALLAQAVEAEMAEFVAKHVDLKTGYWLAPPGSSRVSCRGNNRDTFIKEFFPFFSQH
jgi:hypothetical protein